MANQAQKYLQLILTIGGVAVAILNLWSVSKLSPLYQDLAVVVTRVSAIEKREEGFANRNELSGIEKRLERIEDKIDQLR